MQCGWVGHQGRQRGRKAELGLPALSPAPACLDKSRGTCGGISMRHHTWRKRQLNPAPNGLSFLLPYLILLHLHFFFLPSHSCTLLLRLYTSTHLLYHLYGLLPSTTFFLYSILPISTLTHSLLFTALGSFTTTTTTTTITHPIHNTHHM
ncbi:hypothetical protein EYF80_009546 [Liparis tanakae]|uniref:Uncharacterized protein n=1 Tax=Liparis tanakae TaxID=230148 RepID=A0A4Z2IQX4_9TELE|nr:hypothetical protein EYF80_009546 [Liparis tanakae]